MVFSQIRQVGTFDNNYLQLLHREVEKILPRVPKTNFANKTSRANKQLYTILSSFEMKILDFFLENFAERRVVILHNYLKIPSDGGMIGR